MPASIQSARSIPRICLVRSSVEAASLLPLGNERHRNAGALVVGIGQCRLSVAACPLLGLKQTLPRRFD
jgi:hypothetical protein